MTHIVLVAVPVVHSGHRRIFKVWRQLERADALGSRNLLDIPCSAGSKCCSLSIEDELLAIRTLRVLHICDSGATCLFCAFIV